MTPPCLSHYSLTDGSLSRTFGCIMRALGDLYSEAELEVLFSQIDTDGGGTLDFKEFAEMW